jgi:Protein of unknown function (DUF1102).
MNRRQLIALMGAIGGGGAVATGTGAFSSTSADRSVSVNVAGDTSAYLRLASSNPELTQFVNRNSPNSEFDIALDGDSGNGGSGINTRATTTFDNLFEIQNQGTQEVEVNVDPLAFSTETGSAPALTLQVPSSDFPTFTLGPGDTEPITIIAAVDDGFNIDLNNEEIDRDIAITAEST